MAENEVNSYTLRDYKPVRHVPFFQYENVPVTIRLNELVNVVTRDGASDNIKKGRVIRIKRVLDSENKSCFVLVFRMENKEIMFSARHYRVDDEHGHDNVTSTWMGLSLAEINEWLAVFNTDIFQKSDFEDVQELSYTIRTRTSI